MKCPRLLHWLRITLCLVASWLCWWGVNKWLEPKPLWSATLPDGYWYDPQYEEQAGTRLVAVVMKRNNQDPLNTKQTLAVLDRRTGQELNRIELKEKQSFVDAMACNGPRIHQDVVWFFTQPASDNRLCSWDLKTGKLHDNILAFRQWGYSFVDWPIGSPVFVVRFTIPMQLLFAVGWGNPFQNLIIHMLTGMTLLPSPCWFESYQLADQAGLSPKLLSRWTPPVEHWRSGCEVAPDGRWAVSPEPGRDIRQVYSQAKAAGRTSLRGSELAELSRPSIRGIRVYDTYTGEYTIHHADQAPIHLSRGWLGQLLVVASKQIPQDTEFSLTSFHDFLNSYATVEHFRYQVLKICDGNVKALKTPEIVHPFFPPREDNAFYSNGTSLVLIQPSGTNRVVSEVHASGDQAIIKRNASFPSNEETRWVTWLPWTTQYLAIRVSVHQRLNLKWGNKWLWLDGLLRYIDPWLSKKEDVLLVEEKDGSYQECSFQQEMVGKTWSHFSNLYLLDRSKRPETTLNCYDMPLAIYSPWWGRGAATLPVLVLVLYILKRRSHLEQRRHSSPSAEPPTFLLIPSSLSQHMR